jgi:hypothetical protein
LRSNRRPNLAAAFGTLLGPVAITGADDLRHDHEARDIPRIICTL